MAGKPPARIEVEGLRETVKALRRLGDVDTPKAIRRLNKEAAEMVVREAVPHTPLGKTGNLRRSVKALAGQRDGRVKAGSPARVPYARVIHWGVGAKPGTRGPHNIKGRPFLFDAVNRARQRVLRHYEDSLEDLLRRFR